MAIEKRFIHFKKFSDFNSKKLSANEANTQYTVGVSGEVQDGAPDILYQSYVWIKDTKQQWTHGQIYDCGVNLSQYVTKETHGELQGFVNDLTVDVADLAEDVPYITPFSMADISAYIQDKTSFNYDSQSLQNAIEQNRLVLIPYEPAEGLAGYQIANAQIDDFIYLDIFNSWGVYFVELARYGNEIISISEILFQYTIQDLDEIREGASKGATAVQPDVLQNYVKTDDVVDFATDLTGVPEATPEEFTYRPSAGRKSIRDKSAVIRRIKGSSLVWNQVAQLRDSGELNGLTFTKENDTLRVSGTVTEAFSYDIFHLTNYLPQGLKRDGRKYLISINGPDGIAYGLNGYFIENTKPHFWSAEADSVWFGYISIKIPVGTTVDYVFSNPQIIDLTKMFGAGNEPTTVDEFYARIPEGVDLTAYNAGELISMNANAIETNGFNQWDEEWEVGGIGRNTGENADVTDRIRSKNFIPIIGGETYNFHCASNGKTLSFFVACYDENKKFIGAVENGIYPSTSATDANYHNPWTFGKDVAYIRFSMSPLYGTTYKKDICINLSHSGVRNGEYKPYEKNTLLLPEIAKYFPNGMHGIGDVCDEIIDGLAIQRIGEVNLGNSDIKYDSARSAFYLRLHNSKTLGKGICSKFTLNNISAVNLSDGEMSFHNTYYDQSVIFKATSYTDVASFKSAMSGIKLYYELVEPIYTPIDEPLQLAYEVDDFGTEKMLSDAPSAPFRADIVYQFNAEGRIRDNSRNIESIEGQIKTLYSGSEVVGSIENKVSKAIAQEVERADAKYALPRDIASLEDYVNDELDKKVSKTDNIGANKITGVNSDIAGYAQNLPVLSAKVQSLNSNILADLKADEFYIEKTEGDGTWQTVDHTSAAVRSLFTCNGLQNGFTLSPNESWPVGSQFRITIYPKTARQAWVDFFAINMYCNARYFNISAEWCDKNDGGNPTWIPTNVQVEAKTNGTVLLSYGNWFGFEAYNRWGIRFTFEVTREYQSYSRVWGIAAYSNHAPEIHSTADNAIWTIGKDYLPDADKNVTFPEKVIARSFEDRSGNKVVMSSDLSAVATSGNYNDLTNKPPMPIAVTESTVSGWGFTKNTGTYSKPSGGIPKSDLASAVQTSLGKADTALQSYTEQYKGTVTGVKINGTTKNPTSGVVDLGTVITDISGKQDKLVEGTNIKQVFTTNDDYGILGEGNLYLASVSPNTSKVIATGIWNNYDIIEINSGGLEFIPELETPDTPRWSIHRNGDGTKFLSNDGTYKTISGGSSGANVQAVDTGDVIDDVTVNYATKTYVDGLVGDINSVLESIING